MNEYTDLIFAYRHGVALELYSIEEVVLWAEHLFEENPFPEEWMIQLAISTSIDDVIEALDPILFDMPMEVVWNKLIKILYEALEHKKIGSCQAIYYVADYASEEERTDNIFYLMLAFDDLQNGYGSQKEIDEEVLQYFKKINTS